MIKADYPRNRDDEYLAHVASKIMKDIVKGSKQDTIEYYI